MFKPKACLALLVALCVFVALAIPILFVGSSNEVAVAETTTTSEVQNTEGALLKVIRPSASKATRFPSFRFNIQKVANANDNNERQRPQTSKGPSKNYLQRQLDRRKKPASAPSRSSSGNGRPRVRPAARGLPERRWKIVPSTINFAVKRSEDNEDG